VNTLQPLRVLIVEDEGLLAMDIEGTVEDEGHIVAGWATSADEALALYDASQPDIVFLDIQLMHGTSGLDVARGLQNKTGAKYVFMTANGRLVDEDMQGSIGVLEKPFSSSKLVAVLAYLQQGLIDPPPTLPKPGGFRLGPVYTEAWA
jgi:DNA-binding response OmpR family regulator